MITVTQGTYCRNTISYTGGGSGTHTLTRTAMYTDGRAVSVPVAGAVNVPGAQPDVWVDGDVPYGQTVESVTYRFGAHEETAPVDQRCHEILSNPMTGLSVNVAGTEIGSQVWQSATEATWRQVTVGDSPEVSTRPEQSPVQSFSLHTTSRYARDAVNELMSRRQPLCLRSGTAGVEDVVWFVVIGERIVERRLPKVGADERRVHTWDMHTITRPDPATTRHALHNLGELAAHGLTLADIAAQWPTLGDVALASLVAENTEGMP